MKCSENRRRAITGALCLLGIALMFTSCPPRPLLVKLDYHAPEAALGGNPPRNVIVHLSPVVDARSNRDTIGQTSVSVLPASDVLLWVQDGLVTLADQGFDLSMSGSDPPDGYRLRVTVTRVYCRSTITTLRSSVVLSVEYFRDGVLKATREHRGEDVYEDNSPFEGSGRFSQGRVQQVLNNGLAETVAQIAATIEELEAQ